MTGNDDPIGTARSLVTERFPTATAALLGGTVLTSARTATSDLDIVVVLPGKPAPFRETISYDGWTVELFVSTPDSLEHYITQGIAARRSPLLHMCAQGTILLDVDQAATRVQREALARLEAGPAPASAAELDGQRYRLSDLLDDLAGVGDPDELVFIATRLLTTAAETVLLARRSWLGSGKWILRQLRQTDPELTRRLVDAYQATIGTGQREPLMRVVQGILDEVGGRLMEGYHQPGQDPLAGRQPPKQHDQTR